MRAFYAKSEVFWASEMRGNGEGGTPLRSLQITPFYSVLWRTNDVISGFILNSLWPAIRQQKSYGSDACGPWVVFRSYGAGTPNSDP